MAKVTLIGATPWPPPHGLMRHSGTVLEVSEDEREMLVARGLVADVSAQQEPAVPVEHQDEGADENAPVSPVEVSAVDTKFGPLPKKTQGINAWREYAREHDIDVRGLSEKPELMGHIIKVVNS